MALEEKYRLPRETVRQVACPTCGASPGDWCRGRTLRRRSTRTGAAAGTYVPRKSNHIERIEVALGVAG